jgi:hypothetical protein
MSIPTLHTGFNKLILIDPIRKGIVNSAIQYSIYIPSIETVQKGGVDYPKGELFQIGFNTFEQFVNKRNVKAYFTYAFKKTARELALKEDICVYCFMLPNAKGHLSYAISTHEGCRYIELVSKNDKQVSINQYIVKTLNQDGWF